MHWFADFLFLYAFGVSAVVLLVPEAAIGRYFHKFHSMLALAMVIVAVVVGKPLFGAPPQGFAAAAQVSAIAFAVVVFLLSAVIHISTVCLKPEMLGIPVSMGAIFAVVDGFARTPARWEAALISLHYLTMAAMLGSVLVAMILGHWYLQNAALSFDHLVRLSRLFVAACVAKIVVSGVLAGLQFAKLQAMLSSFDMVYLATRVGAGLVGSLALALMTLSCAKAKANQSATGILYAAVFFVLVGELMSMYLTQQRGVPL